MRIENAVVIQHIVYFGPSQTNVNSDPLPFPVLHTKENLPVGALTSSSVETLVSFICIVTQPAGLQYALILE